MDLIKKDSPNYGEYYLRPFAIVDLNDIYLQCKGNHNKLSIMSDISDELSNIALGYRKPLSYKNHNDETVGSPMVFMHYAPFLSDNKNWDDKDYYNATGYHSDTLPIGYDIDIVKSKLENLKQKYIFEILI